MVAKLDRMVGVQGRFERDGGQRREWVWRVGGKGEVFRPVVERKHVKFE